MSTLNPPHESAPAIEAGTPTASGEVIASRRSGNWRTQFAILTMVVPALLLLAAGLIAGPPPKDGEIASGVRVGGFDLSSTGWEATESDLKTRTDAYLDQPITLAIDGQQVETTARELGFAYDLDATLDEAMDIGRGDLFAAARERFTARTSGTEIDPVVTYDQDQFFTAISSLSQGAVYPPESAQFTPGPNGVAVQPSQDGLGIDTTAAQTRISDVVQKLRSGVVEVPTVAIEPEITTAELEALLDDANQFAGAPVVLRDGARAWELSPQELGSLLRYDDSGVELDMQGLALRVATLNETIRDPARNAQLERSEDGGFEIIDGSVGRTLDVDATVDSIESAFADGERSVDLVVEESSPAITRDDVFPVYRELTSIVTRGMTVVWADGEVALDSVEFSEALIWDLQNQEVGFSRDAIADALAPALEAATRKPSNIRWKNGQLVTTEDSQPGMKVAVDPSIDNIIEQAKNGESVAELVVTESEQLDAVMAGIEIEKVLGSSATYYGNSSHNRKVNVETAAQALDGVLVAPHSEFSFNDAIGGTATVEDGYMMGYGIMTDDSGTPVTVPSVAGGICQVSTTVFQAAFWAGMPITNRTWHMYWIPRYGEGPGGLKGLDATVDPDYNLDFNFRNPTDDWLAIRANADGEWISVDVLGVDQGWTVEVDDPVITDVVEASDEIVRQEDPSVSPGSEVWVESAQDGFHAAIHRVVKDADGNVIDDHTFTSYYVPARNVVLVAPGEDNGN